MVQAFNRYGRGPNSTVLFAAPIKLDQEAFMGAGATLGSILTALIALCS